MLKVAFAGGLPERRTVKRHSLILISAIVVLLAIVLSAWYALASQQPRLTFDGCRYSPADGRWYADLQFKNRSKKNMHCDGYVLELAGGLKTNETMLDFQCIVEVGDKQVQSWPLWFATWLDVKPGESVKLRLNIDPNNPPKRIALKYSEAPTPPSRIRAALGTARYYVRRWLHLKPQRRVLNNSDVLWCPSKLPLHADPDSNATEVTR